MTNELLKNYKKVETEDGSITLYSESYGEACHSTSGARLETQLHYIEGCEVLKRAHKHKQINIFEVGFGTGIGFQETLSVLKDKSRFLFTSLEIDEDLIKYFIKRTGINLEKINAGLYSFESDDFHLEIFLGDARQSIKNISNEYHAIYQDAFSPKRNATLWTTEWFRDLKNISHYDCIMSTYSASSSIRKSMIAAGWKLYSGEKFGPKRSSTRARLTGETEEEITLKLERSPAVELTDNTSKDYKL